jgi:hypothetical protein
MQIVTLNERVACTQAQARVATVDPGSLQSVSIQNLGANIVELGAQGVTYGAGYPLGVGEVLILGWEDFSPPVRAIHSSLEIWGICNTGLTASVQVFGWARG